MVLYMGIVLYAPALALEAVTDISKVNAILIIGKSLAHFRPRVFSKPIGRLQVWSARFTRRLAA